MPKFDWFQRNLIQHSLNDYTKIVLNHKLCICRCRHELIRNFKFEDDTLKIYASGNEENYEDVKEFVNAYFRPDVKTEVFMDQNTEGI